jgi:hypothetical protein
MLDTTRVSHPAVLSRNGVQSLHVMDVFPKYSVSTLFKYHPSEDTVDGYSAARGITTWATVVGIVVRGVPDTRYGTMGTAGDDPKKLPSDTVGRSPALVPDTANTSNSNAECWVRSTRPPGPTTADSDRDGVWYASP